jgi:DNA-binding NtrC family response regulator
MDNFSSRRVPTLRVPSHEVPNGIEGKGMASMNAGLFVLSQDAGFLEELHERLSSRFDLVVAHSLAAARDPLLAKPVGAALAHLAPAMLNGTPVRSFLAELERVVPSVPIYGLIDPQSPPEVGNLAAERVHQCLPMPVDFDALEHFLESHSPIAVDLEKYYAGLPNRRLMGQSRSLVSFTPSMFETLDELKVAAAHDVTVLLIGETGSGKTYMARMIHELSNRASQRCLTVACGALPPDLIESELFGYVKGAFTGADSDKQGKFAAAEEGTLLLDEIDVLAPEQQAKLLRVIETGEYEPVGSNDTQTSSARLVAASNIDLESLVEAGRFRKDLYYRLNTLSFHLPPLHERTWDIEYLARKFALDHGRAHGIVLRDIEPAFLVALKEYRWPGNIRELENVIRRAVLYCRDGVLTLSDLPSAMRPAGTGIRSGWPRNGRKNGQRTESLPANGKGRAPTTLEARIDEIEHRIIEESLRNHKNHRTDTARELGISRVTLYNKMKKFGMLN